MALKERSIGLKTCTVALELSQMENDNSMCRALVRVCVRAVVVVAVVVIVVVLCRAHKCPRFFSLPLFHKLTYLTDHYAPSLSVMPLFPQRS